MKFEAMFSPVQIGNVTIPNRFAVPPMGNNFADTDGNLSDRSLAYYEARARGGFGLITIESTVVWREAKGGPRKPCLFSDETIPSFRRVADACHRYGAKVSIQLQHAGPEGNSALTGYPLKAASAVPAACGREVPEAVSREELYQIIESYGDAARRAQQAGIDMAEVHCAHGYLVSTFLSERTNHRTDEFGGCFENRMRLPRLIIENIREKTGGSLPILCRINACDEVEGGQSVEDAAAVAAYLEQECGIDAIHVTRSIHIHDEFMWAPNITHGGFNAELGQKVEENEDALMAEVMPQDLHKFGMIPEFIGRIPVITSTKELTEDDLVRILTEPKNALVKQYRRMFELEGVELEFEDEALREIARQALSRGTGARGLRAICEATLQDTMFDLPSDLDITRVVVTKESVGGGAKPTIVSKSHAKHAN